ncbi:unnamed protein product [Phytophthora fragariaefolia]|uniref:Unnamed protein product n=1 Tax=Phytophthora fragariaefolia TaxID=1490495 RepID=A0A9W6XBF5_9STRA|nr:unnamed protein product [Phytophthora fragariaefolia]
MVKPRGKVVRDSDVTSRDLSFRSMWRELKAQGWSSKRPPRRSLDDRYRYIRPGGNPEGASGVELFLGEEAVLEYYANGNAELERAAQVVRETYGALIEATTSRAQDATNAGPIAAPASSTTSVIPPGIPEVTPRTPVQVGRQVTPNTFQGGSSRPTRRSLAQTESPMSSTPTRTTNQDSLLSDSLCATSPHVCKSSSESADEDTGSDGTCEPDDASVESAEDVVERGVSEEEDGEENALNNALPADSDDDLNAVGDGEDAAEYGAMKSGDEAEKGDLETGEDGGDVSADTYEPPEEEETEATETEIAAEVLFAETFLDSFGGEDQVLAGNLKNAVLRGMSATGWEDVEEPDTYDYLMTPYEPVNNAQSYPGLQMVDLRVDGAYKRYRNRRRANPELPKKTKRDIRNELEGTKPILPHELCRFIGLLIARTIAPNREKIAHHWKTTDEGAISRGAFGSVLRRDRFMEISRNLHFNPNSDPRAVTDRAWKIRKVVEVLQKTFERGYVAPSHLAFDKLCCQAARRSTRCGST